MDSRRSLAGRGSHAHASVGASVRAVTGSGKAWINIPLHFVAVGALLFFGIMMLNTAVERPDSRRCEQAEVVAKVRHRHTRYRRVSRNRRVPDGYTWTYGLKLRLADGREVEEPVSEALSRRTPVGSRREAEIRTGVLTWDVVSFKKKKKV